MSYVVNNHLNNLYVLSNKAVGPGKKSKINKRRAYVYFGGLSICYFIRKALNYVKKGLEINPFFSKKIDKKINEFCFL